LGDIRRFARKSIQKGAEFFLACARMSFAPGSDGFLKKLLRIQFQRNAASQCLSGKLSFHLRVQFDSDRHRHLTVNVYYGMVTAQSRSKPGWGGAMIRATNYSNSGSCVVSRSLASRRAIPEKIRALAPDIPWRQIAGMRNVLVHGYFEVDTDLVWDAATRDVPKLKPAIERLLAVLDRSTE
jgi:hypothetical protein